MADPPPPCRHFTRGHCRLGDACRFTHDPSVGVRARSTTKSGRSGRGGVDPRKKVQLFTDFLRETFDDLRDARVLDVAGGKGALAFDVCNRTSATGVTVIDPRPMKRDALRARWTRWLASRTEVEKRDGAAVTVREPEHLRVYWTREVWEGRERAVRASWELARSSRWCVSGLVADSGDGKYEDGAKSARVRVSEAGIEAPMDALDANEDAESDATFEETFEALDEAIKKCTHVVAMHPDQATDAAVDFALERGLPFAVVPCCVYSKEFSTRRLRSGERVSTHDQLVTYLAEKAGIADVRVAELPFRGKNRVVYSLGRVRSSCAPIEN
ncbi:Putative E3 ubiquitin-protein ligase,makorin-related [Ostreococcus tauri]|uniref:E3 ubiquitin-protein ligase,makorin-related n=1 Tax=Ostreococcus tauri TaxID=70448 RepID=Q00XT6_OSTTA|nr:Putative E3 ubiquitin-protein ligase,makorin-related [Ostreococcus tauri]CAL57315.1 Putative E3 ubiquitin-protein ligase,makorin-related [Ostreococcus tauri]|eukprot:XP_003082369.1 Putative E3 ubiquitin-protein ligase,makorin-related [Ostreococcus tauri]